MARPTVSPLAMSLLAMSLLAMSLLLVSLIGVDPATGQTSDESQAQELAERHAPIFELRAQQGPCDDTGEQYAPAAADLVLDNDQILLRQVGDGNPVIKVGPGAEDLHNLGAGFYLDFPGDALNPGCIYEKDFQRYSDGRPAVVYAHIVGQDDAPGKLALQYWFFYYYNDYNNLHEGDWEGIQLLFDVATVGEALAVDPASVGYSQHFGGEIAAWDDDKLERRGDRPVVYPAVGSHASYFNSTLYLGRSGSQGFGCDNTEGPSVTVDPDVVVVPSEVEDASHPLAWIDFEGKWGERQSGPFDGPTGPTQKERWTAPVDWHDELRSSSVAVPGSSNTDTPVVGSFCTIVGWGSARYIEMQQNPLPLLLIVVAAAVVAYFVLRRTTWNRVEPVPIARRRTFGEILLAASGVHRVLPSRAAEIGFIYLPIALLVGLATWLIQQPLLLALPDGADSNLGPIGLLIAGTMTVIGQVTTALLVTAAVSVFMLGMERGEEPRGLDSYRQALAKARPLAAGAIRAGVEILLLAVTIVGIPWAIHRFTRYQFLAQVTMLEGREPKAALRRSAQLVSGRWFHTAMVIALLNATVSAVNLIVGFLLLIILAGLPLWLFTALVTAASATVVPFSAFGTVMLYGDARAELEGLPPADPLPDEDRDDDRVPADAGAGGDQAGAGSGR